VRPEHHTPGLSDGLLLVLSVLVPYVEGPHHLLQPRERRVLVEAVVSQVLGICRHHSIAGRVPLQGICGVERDPVDRCVVPDLLLHGLSHHHRVSIGEPQEGLHRHEPLYCA
jgi:hypothetical protein